LQYCEEKPNDLLAVLQFCTVCVDITMMLILSLF
jgi:hypothetical protein